LSLANLIVFVGVGFGEAVTVAGFTYGGYTTGFGG